MNMLLPHLPKLPSHAIFADNVAFAYATLTVVANSVAARGSIGNDGG